MDPAVDMSAIQEALQRRQQGQATPALNQMSAPQGQLPTGGMATPLPPQNPIPQGGMPQPQSQGQKKAGGLPFDTDTRSVAKVLIQKLMQVL